MGSDGKSATRPPAIEYLVGMANDLPLPGRSEPPSCCGTCGCGGSIPYDGKPNAGVSSAVREASAVARRDFFKLGMFAAAGAAISVWHAEHATAGPFSADDLDDFPIPADKKLDAAWVSSLSARGEPTVYRSQAGELEHLGMPVGGICCGQVYLGGDGTLWHWDIFNLPQATEWSHSAGPLYAKPAPRKNATPKKAPGEFSA